MDKSILNGKWAIVTGASSGIGWEFSKHLASAGMNLLMISNQNEALMQCADYINGNHSVKARTLCVDLASSQAMQEIKDVLHNLPQAPMILINNAGIFDFREVSSLSERRIDTYIDLHIRAVTKLCRMVGEIMAKEGRGWILNMASMACWMPMPGIAMYSATKSYIHSFSRAYRIEMLSKGVSVMVACPGGIATDLFGLPPRLQKVGVAVGALATPSKFASKAINRLLKGRAQYVNGMINRLAIVAVGSAPEWMRKLVKTQLLDRFSKCEFDRPVQAIDHDPDSHPAYFVTGATGGIGRSIIRNLMRMNDCTIVMGVRNIEKGNNMVKELKNELPNNHCLFHFVKLDLSSFDSVNKAAEQVLEGGYKFDALINNAGIMPSEKIITNDGHELATQVNYLSTKSLTEKLLSTVKNGGVIVFTTSITRFLGKDRADSIEYAKKRRGIWRRFYVYGQSKRMLTKYAKMLAERVKDREIRVNCADPGVVDTDMITMGNRVVDNLARIFFRPFIAKSDDGALPAMRAMTSKETCRIFTRKKNRENTF